MHIVRRYSPPLVCVFYLLDFQLSKIVLTLGLASTTIVALPNDNGAIEARTPECFSLTVFTNQAPLCVDVASGNTPVNTATLLANAVSFTQAEIGKCKNTNKRSTSYIYFANGNVPAKCKIRVYTTLGCTGSFDTMNVDNTIGKCMNEVSPTLDRVQSFKLVC